MIIMLYGLPMSGKSFCAQKLKSSFEARETACVVIKSVKTRDPASTVRFTTASIDETIPQTKQEKDESYRKMIEIARKAVREGKHVILDATFHKKYRREWVYSFAREQRQELVVIHCDYNTQSQIRSILAKRAADDSTKDNILNTFEMYSIMRDQQEPLSAEELKMLKIMKIGVGGGVSSNFSNEFTRAVQEALHG